MKGFVFWQKWMLVMGVLVVLMGFALPVAALLDIQIEYINSVFWSDGATPTSAKAFQAWMYGVYGAMSIAFGLFICFIANSAFKAREKWASTCLGVCISVWFAIDTFFSVRFGAYANAFNNVILYLLLVAPIVFTRRAFVSRDAGAHE